MVLAVVLENNVWTYFPGQTINGNVVVTKNIWHKVEGLSIRFLGKMEFGSAASSPIQPPDDALPPSYNQERSLFERIKKCRPSQDIILDHKMNVLHSWKVLKPGSHEFPFSYTLPDDLDLPESTKIDGFRVLYEFIVVLRRPRDDFKIYQTPFYVHSRILDHEPSVLNVVPIFTEHFEKKTEDKIGFCICCKSGPYGLLFRVSKRIVAVGEDVDFVLEIWNETRSDMDCAKIRLVRLFKHKKGLETKKKEVVSELSGPRVASGSHEVWSSFFRIPGNTPPSSFVRRDTYEINYILKALIHPLNQPSKSISVKCPLLVVRGTGTVSPSAPNLINYEVGGGGVHIGAGDVVVFDAAPPPSYAEVMGMEKDNTSSSPLLE